MKKILLMATAAFVAWSCTEKIDSTATTPSTEGEEVTITLSMGTNAETRVALEDNAEGGLTASWSYSGTNNDTTNDDVHMWGEGESSTSIFWLNSCEGDTATLSGTASYTSGRAFMPVVLAEYMNDKGTVTNGKYAVSYASQSASNNSYAESGASIYMISDNFFEVSATGYSDAPSMLHIGSAIKVQIGFMNMSMGGGTSSETMYFKSMRVGGGEGKALPISGNMNLSETNIDNVFEVGETGAIEVTLGGETVKTNGDYCEFTINSFPFDLQANESLEFTFIFSSDSGTEYTTTLSVTPSEAWSLPRASFTTISLSGYTSAISVLDKTNDDGNQDDSTASNVESVLLDDCFTSMVLKEGPLGAILTVATDSKYVDFGWDTFLASEESTGAAYNAAENMSGNYCTFYNGATDFTISYTYNDNNALTPIFYGNNGGAGTFEIYAFYDYPSGALDEIDFECTALEYSDDAVANITVNSVEAGAGSITINASCSDDSSMGYLYFIDNSSNYQFEGATATLSDFEDNLDDILNYGFGSYWSEMYVSLASGTGELTAEVDYLGWNDLVTGTEYVVLIFALDQVGYPSKSNISVHQITVL